MILAALIVATLTLAAACGGDDSDDGDDAGDGNGEPTATEPADGGNGTDDGDNGDGDGDGGASIDELRDIAEDYGTFTGRATYDFTTETDGIDFSGTMTIYSDGERSRYEYEVPDGGMIVGITTPDATYSCTSFGGQGFCFEGEGQDAEGSIPFVEDFADPDEIDDTIGGFGDVDVDTSSEEIAGRSADCYSLSGNVEGEDIDARYCFGDDGILLLSTWESQGNTFEMRATEVSTDVSDADFEPPYDIFDLEDLPDIGDIFGDGD